MLEYVLYPPLPPLSTLYLFTPHLWTRSALSCQMDGWVDRWVEVNGGASHLPVDISPPVVL